MATGMWAISQVGGYYQIGTLQDWKDFAALVNGGSATIQGKLTADVDLGSDQTMVGSASATPFKGIFDGQGYTLTIHYNSTAEYCAPFRYVEGASFRNLKVAGTITTTQNYAAGIAGRNINNTIYFAKCATDVAINSSSTTLTKWGHSDYHGCLLAHSENVNVQIENCACGGSINGSSSSLSYCAGLVGVAENCTVSASRSLSTTSYTNIAIINSLCHSDGVTRDASTFYYINANDESSVGTQVIASALNNTTYVNNLGSSDWVLYSRTHQPMLIQFAKYSVTYNANGGSSAPAVQSKLTYEGIYLSNTTLTRSGLVHSGWNTKADGTGTHYNKNAYYTTDADLALYAEWTFQGSGTENDPYLIPSADVWNFLADKVAAGTTYAGVYFRQTANISVTTPIGSFTDETHFKTFNGIYDGNGKTLTVTINQSGKRYVAPFHYISGATIKNLIVTGSVSVSGSGGVEAWRHPAGLVGATEAGSTSLVENCRVSTNVSGSDYIGGIVGNALNSSITIRGCVYSGTLTANNNNYAGGLLGWGGGGGGKTISIVNSLFCGSYTGSGKFHPVGCFYDPGNYTRSVSNTYYTVAPINMTDEDGNSFVRNLSYKGKYAYLITGGTHVSVNPGGMVGVYDVSGISTNGLGLKYNGAIYAANGETISLELSGAPAYIATTGTLTGSSNPYSLAMTSANSVIKATFQGSGTALDPYLIPSTAVWNILSTNVNEGNTYSGKFFRQTADIDVTTMVGTSSCKFQGTYDGDGHTLTVNYSTAADYTGPFRYINGATFKNLHTAGTINVTAKFAGGFAGLANGANTFYNCRSSVTINSNREGDGSNGGFIGILNVSGTTTSSFEGCVFDGRFISSNTSRWGGYIGWSGTNVKLSLVNCLFAPTELAMQTTNNLTITRTGDTLGIFTTITNTYYTELLTNKQAKKACSITGASGVTVANAGLSTYYSVSEITGYTTGVAYGGVLYGGENESISLTLDGSSNYKASAGTLTGSGNPRTLTMAEANTIIYGAASILAAPTPIEGLEYSGSAQTLINAGTASGGTMQYSLDGSSWSTTLPTGTNAGDYTVYYKVEGDANHADYIGSSVSVTIKTYVIDGKLRGVFSVGEGTKVQFSQGNLQAVFASAGTSCTWQFGTEQYDYVGNAAANNAINGNGSVSAAGTVDLFGWSTGSTYYGINNSSDAGDYSGDFVDWGNLAISNGGNTTNSDWRTLTRDEWAYLFTNHTYGYATVAGVKGIIIVPDNYSGTAINSDHSNTENPFARNTIDASTWASTYELAGVIFLPAAGFRIPWIGQVQENAYYWSSTPVDGTNKYATLVGKPGNGDIITYGSGGNWPANDGFSVRLVKNAPMASVTAPTAIDGLEYSGSAQTLIHAGSSADGEIQYKLGDGDWSTSLPSATNAGSYTVYYRVIADDDHSDNPGSSVAVTINKVLLHVRADNKSVTFGDAAPAYTASYSGFVLDEDESVLGGTLTFICIYTPTSPVGTYPIFPSGLTATNYSIIKHTGTLTVNAPAGLVLYDNADPTTQLEGLNGSTLDVTINRSIVAGCYNTICLPFDLSASQIAASPLAGYSDLKAFDGADVTGSGQNLFINIYVRDVDHIEAGVPYLISYPSEHGNIVNPLFNDVTFSETTPSGETHDGVTFQGMFGPVHITTYAENVAAGRDEDYLFLGANNRLLWPNDDGTSMRGFRAYFIIHRNDIPVARAPRGTNARIVTRTSTATDVENVQRDQVQCTKVLENGVLYIIKNGVKYDAQGKKLR